MNFPKTLLAVTLLALVIMRFVLAPNLIPLGSALGDSAGVDTASTFEPVQTKFVITAAVSLVVLAASLFVILSKRYTTADTKWAFGTVGTLLGYWLH